MSWSSMPRGLAHLEVIHETNLPQAPVSLKSDWKSRVLAHGTVSETSGA